MTNVKQIAAALIAFDPLLARQALAEEDIDMDRVKTVLARLHEVQPGIKWAWPAWRAGGSWPTSTTT
jgi:hypothetical protein